MLDLNHILLFVACVSPVVVLLRTARRPALDRGWWIAAVAVLIVTAFAYLISPASAGFIGGGAWFVLLLLPIIGFRKASELSLQQRFSSARRILDLLRFVHPLPALRDERSLLRALELAQRGDMRAADEILARLAQGQALSARRAQARRFRIHEDWSGLVVWCRQNIPRAGLGDDPSVLPLYFRALGETGLRDELVLQFAGRVPSLLASPIYEPTFALSLLVLLAFGGRAEAVRNILETRLRKLPADLKEFWIATSEWTEGDPTARIGFEQIRARTADHLVRADCAYRLARTETALPPISLPNESTIERFARAVMHGSVSILPTRSFRPTPAVLTIIAINLVFFMLEVSLGGSMNGVALYRLGALEPTAVMLGGEYWRLLAALFLHFGALHLFVNLYALYVLGPPLETIIGTLRFAFCYLISGLGSTAGVVLLWRFGLVEAITLVGASGAVMGVVGTWAGFLALHRHVPMARRRLFNIAVIVVVQTIFDLYIPQISLAAHLCGLTTGFVLGLLIAPRRDAV